MEKYKTIIIVFILGVIIVGSWTFFASHDRAQKSVITSTPIVSQADTTSLLYKGKKGENALQLLKDQTTVEQDASGLIVGINNRRAETTKREYWAFYVNGKMANVGPADYQTKDTDTIEWRIEHY